MKQTSKILTPLALIILHQFSLAAEYDTAENDVVVEFGCQFHATDFFSQASQENSSTTAGNYLELMAKASELEGQLVELDLTDGSWSEQQTNILLKLAKIKHSIGDTIEARTLYEDALYLMRINEGVYSLDQIPVMLDLMSWYVAADDEFVDQLGDRALFLYEKNYVEDDQIPQLIDGYRKIIDSRLHAHFSGDIYDSIHARKVASLDKKILDLIDTVDQSQRIPLYEIYSRWPGFYTRYNDLGEAVSTPEAGMDQVSNWTGEKLAEVQGLMRDGDSTQQDLDNAKLILDELYGDFDQLEFVDRAALLDFYADYYLIQENIPEAISAYERLLNIRVLRPDYQLRAMRALGQMYEEQLRWTDAVDSYNCWRQLSTREDSRVLIGLANSHRHLEQYVLAIHHLLRYIEILDREGQVADRNLYVILKNMYYDTDNLEAGAEVTRTMVALFD